MYSFESRVRYSEVDHNKYMDLSSIINYFQDCSMFQSEDLSVGLDYLESKKRVWMLSSWQIIVNRRPVLGENITIGTWAYGFKGMYGYRNFVIKDQHGQVVAAANSIWIYMDTVTLRPTRVFPEDVKAYGTEPRYEMEYADRKILVPDNLEEKDPFTVVKSNIDTNQHVNNGQYVKMAEEYLPESFQIRQMRADYKKSALLGDTIIPHVSLSDTKCTVILSDAANTPYAIIEFTA
ncbi:MAG: acyl-[acyl-carrier-protein] thioesterase [Lachnospiraceae bacterium]|nr:acyl-[acyl-carrier-protein] thioesterase [Lachnospiraceae bacterium]